MKTAQRTLLGVLGSGALLAAHPPAAATDSTACGAAPCTTPSRAQADMLFQRIEQAYPQFFPAGAVTGSTTLEGGTAYYRSYDTASQTGLATYQGGLWYAVNSQWQRHASLDDGNRQFCAGTCWNGATTTLGYPVVDTGQNASYDTRHEIAAPLAAQPFFGQDAQTAGAQPSYQTSTDGKTVADRVTGLTWMRAPNTTLATPTAGDKKTLSQAQAWVGTVNAMAYGGYSDWRLPTIKELYSLISFRGTDPSGYTGTNTALLTPFIDTRYFLFGYGQLPRERIIDSQYASSTLFVVNPDDSGAAKLFGVNFADGRIKGYDLTMPGGSEKTFFVQLVRGPVSYGTNQYRDNGDGTVSDAATGLMWSKDDSTIGMTWTDALAWVQTRNATNHLGHSDWRLPNAKELQSIVNYTNAPDFNGKPAIDTRVFNTTATADENGDTDYPCFWSSTTHATYLSMGTMGSAAVYVAFGRANGYSPILRKWIDIHGAGAQRSDPKIGPPYTEYTTYTVTKNGTSYTGYAHGPQGDAIRGLNFVRLVRDDRN